MRRQSIVLDVWVAVLALVLCAPLFLRTGYPLARDLVFTPHQPMTPETLGLGSLPPRAVPLDALVWLLGGVLDGAVLARILVPGALLVAGWGAHRLVEELPFGARVVVGGLAVWNPYVVERLALGQWALLWCYAALWWLVAAARRGSLLTVVGWLALASITPTGGVIALGTAVALTRSWRIAAAGFVLQLPWLLPAVLSTAAVTSDPAGVDAFAARAERAGGALLSLLGLGGVWDSGSAPGTRSGVLGHLTTAVAVLLLVAGARAVARRFGWSLLVVGAAGLLLAVASSVPGLDGVVRWAVEAVPGAGLLRDAQKWLMPFVVVVALCAGEVAARVKGGWLVVAAFVPVLLLPDAPAATWQTVTPVQYPDDFGRVAAALDSQEGDLAVLPWRAYRRFEWGRPVSVYDPASRWFDRTVVTADALTVGNIALAGESGRAAQVERLLKQGRPADVLGEAGIGWVLVYRDDPSYDELDLAGLIPVEVGEELALYRVPGPVAETGEVSRARVAVVAAVDLAVLLGVIGVVCVGLARRRKGLRK